MRTVYGIWVFSHPDYQVGDNVVAYSDRSGYFRVFYKGDITTLESYYPETYVCSIIPWLM